jgi:hypothetical protein
MVKGVEDMVEKADFAKEISVGEARGSKGSSENKGR